MGSSDATGLDEPLAPRHCDRQRENLRLELVSLLRLPAELPMQRLPVGIGILNAISAGEGSHSCGPEQSGHGGKWSTERRVELIATVGAAIGTCRDVRSDGCWISHALALPDEPGLKQRVTQRLLTAAETRRLSRSRRQPSSTGSVRGGIHLGE